MFFTGVVVVFLSRDNSIINKVNSVHKGMHVYVQHNPPPPHYKNILLCMLETNKTRASERKYI